MSDTSPAAFSGWRLAVKVVLLFGLLLVANLLARQLFDSLDFAIRPSTEDRVHYTIMLTASLYTLLLAVPFVPGAEIGIALMATLGPKIAPLVYLCTLGGLVLAFVVGRLVPLEWLIDRAARLGWFRLERRLREIRSLGRKRSLAAMIERAPRSVGPLLLRYRYLALAILLNLPGNYLVGGGGGIALFAGISRLFSIPGFLLTIALAVVPVPLAVLLFGSAFLG